VWEYAAVLFHGGSLGPLRERPFRLLFLGRTLSVVGDAIVPVAITFAVLDIGAASDQFDDERRRCPGPVLTNVT